MRLVSLFSIAVLTTFTAAAQPKPIDKVIAQVGDNVVLLSDVQGQKIQALQAGVALTPELDCQIIEDLMMIWNGLYYE